VLLETGLAFWLWASSIPLCRAGSYCVGWDKAKALLRVAWPAFAGAVSVGLQGAGLIYLSGKHECVAQRADMPELAEDKLLQSTVRSMPSVL